MAAPHLDRGRLALDGQFWGLSTKWSAALLATPLAGAALVALAHLRPGLYHALVHEDGTLEWLQFAAYVTAAGAAAAAAHRLWSYGRLRLAVLLVVMAACCVFAGGEEISWGQRLLELDTPDALKAVNDQEELNVHNVGGLRDAFTAAVALASLYGILAPALSRRPSLVVPPFALGTAFLVTLLYTSARALFFRHPTYDLAKYSEWPETCFAGALAAFAFLILRAVAARGRNLAHVDPEPG